MTPVSLQQLSSVTGGQLLDVPEAGQTFERVCTDSRKVRQGDLFWALDGERVDGHDFVSRISDRVSASVVARDRADQTSGPRIVVEDSVEAMAQLAAWYRQQHDVLTVGVTGSVGKTSTRSLIHLALSAQFEGLQSPANYNNHLGVPLTLFGLEQQHEFAVVELGASAVGEIEGLARIADVEIGVITGISPAHLEGFGSLEAICQAKGELLEQLPEEGFAVLAGDDPLVREMSSRARCRCLFAGVGPDNDLRATSIQSANGTSQFSVQGVEFHLPVAGEHFVRNALLAIAVGQEVGIPLEAIAARLADYEAPAGRSQVKRTTPWTVIDDTYNSNPGSVQSACETLSGWQGCHRRLLVTGDMLELGEESSHWHQEVGRMAAEAGVDHLVALGDHAGDVIAGAMQGGMARFRLAECRTMEALQLVLDCWLETDDVVLVKGSRGMRMERVVDWLDELARETLTAQQGDHTLPAVA